MLGQGSSRSKHGSSKWFLLSGFAALVFLFLIATGGLGSKDPTQSTKLPNGYDDTYPLSKSSSGVYELAVISDLDENSKDSNVGDKKDKWHAFYKPGTLTRASSGSYDVEWHDSIEVKSNLAAGGRGMELSELVVYNKKMFTCDDRTGVVYELKPGHKGHIDAIPRAILMEGDGETQKGLKCEWMAVKDGLLYVGGFGKEYTDHGVATSTGPMWVKILDTEYRVTHHDWTAKYNALREKAGCPFPGYLLHESAAWNDDHKRWYFLPRRVSKEIYDEFKDEERGSNLMLDVNNAFHKDDVVIRTIGTVDKTHGFSSFKFIPDRPEEVIALKTVEFQGTTETYAMVFTLSGEILMEEKKIASFKYEGIEFL